MVAHGFSSRQVQGPLGHHFGASVLLGRIARNICSGHRSQSESSPWATSADHVVVKGKATQCHTIHKTTESQFARRYRVGKQVMKSGHAGMAVLFATRLADGQKVVVKSLDRQTSFGGAAHECKWRGTMEALMNMPKACTICDLIEVIKTPDNYYVVMERIRGQDLFETILQKSLDMKDVRAALRQILEGLAILHGAGRIHKDLKLANVMLSWNASMGGEGVSAKIIDFDTVDEWRPCGPTARDVIGTDGYIAPEAYRGDYSPASDMYAVGVMMYALLTGRLPFPFEMFDDGPGENFVGSPAMERIRDSLERHQINFEIGELGACAEAADLCRSLLAFDAHSRPSAEEALNHRWLIMPRESPCDQSPTGKKDVTCAKRHVTPRPSDQKRVGIVCVV